MRTERLNAKACDGIEKVARNACRRIKDETEMRQFGFDAMASLSSEVIYQIMRLQYRKSKGKEKRDARPR